MLTVEDGTWSGAVLTAARTGTPATVLTDGVVTWTATAVLTAVAAAET